MERAVHLALPVSLWMVMQVVEQGQCIREKSMVQTAVRQVQPWAMSRPRMAPRSGSSESVPSAR